MIYIIHAAATDYYKVGISAKTAIHRRVDTLQIGCPFTLTMIAQADWPDHTERRIHKLLKPHHVRGEWFAINPDLHSLIQCFHEGKGYYDWLLIIKPAEQHTRLGAVLQFNKTKLSI
jgi:hypothetical protein